MFRHRKVFLPKGVPKAPEITNSNTQTSNIKQDLQGSQDTSTKPQELISEPSITPDCSVVESGGESANLQPPDPPCEKVPQLKLIDGKQPQELINESPIIPDCSVIESDGESASLQPPEPPSKKVPQLKLIDGKLVIVDGDSQISGSQNTSECNYDDSVSTVPEDVESVDDSQTALENFLKPKRKLLTKRSKRIKIVTDDSFVPNDDMKMSDLVTITRYNSGSKKTVVNKPQIPVKPVTPKPAKVYAPKLKINDYGEVVIDQESLVVDAGAIAQVHIDNAVVVKDLPRSYTNYRKLTSCNRRWTVADSKRFLMALAMFGTDFSAIAGVFPGRHQRDILNKYKSGLRTNPLVITQMLRKRIKVDYDYFKRDDKNTHITVDDNIV